MAEINHDYMTRNFHLLRDDPERYLALAEELVRKNPDDAHAYFTRHQAFKKLGKYELSLADLDTVLNMAPPAWHTYESRANIFRNMGRYEDALDDLNRAEAVDPEAWAGGFGLLFRAECHARLGHLEAALADCARLPDEHWTPGLLGAPAGNKSQVTAKIHELAAAARRA